MDKMYDIRKQFFNDHAEKWLETWYKDPVSRQLDKHHADFERLFSLLQLAPGDQVLDAGCGAGVLVPYILERITEAGTLFELDFAEKMLEANRSRHSQENIRFVVADVEQAPLDQASCDAVICFSCFPHFYDKQGALIRLREILKPGGKLCIAHFGSAAEINDHHAKHEAVSHDHLPGENEMRQMIKQAGLQIELFMDEPGFYCILARR
jgi:demethylmenaquinone methyltransferase/2-methoxy-6-polyprenyl-1,4-benzoquinol methylase